MIKILLTSIVKDDSEAEVFERMLASFSPYVDGVLVLCTGPSGEFTKIKEMVAKFNGKCFETSPKTHPKIYVKLKDKFIFANFSEARNTLMALADKEKGYDYYTWADCDDILIGGENLHPIAELAKQQKMDAVFFTYWYSVKVKEDNTFNDKNVEIDQLRERLIAPGKFKWVSRLHEIAISKDDAYKPKYTEYRYDPKKPDNIVWVHLTDKERVKNNNERNITLLKLQLEDEEWKDPRTISYLAKTYFDMNQPELDNQAIPLFEKYLELSGWEEERSINWEYLGKIYARKGDHLKALDCHFSAIQEYPNRHLNYLYLSELYFELGRFDFCKFWLGVAERMAPPESRTTIGNPIEIMFMTASIHYNLAMKEMKLDDAIYWWKIRNEIGQIKEDGTLKMLEDAKYFNQIGIAIFNVARYLKSRKHEDKLPKLLEAIPNEYSKEPFVQQIANEIMPPRKWGDKSIVYYASAGTTHFEEWSFKNLEKGIGGSETAVIELSARWAKLGYDVTVFCETPNGEELVSPEGVIYRPWWQMNWQDEFNILVLWRSPHLLDIPIKAKKLYMDLHDVPSNLDYPPERVKKLDHVFFKSNYHRRFVPNIPDSKAVVISNGI